MNWNWATITTLLGIISWIVAFGMLFIVPVNRKPSSATAWLMLIFLLPYIGLLLFLLIGTPKLPRYRREQQRSYYEELLKAGVHVFWYPAPILLHAKHISVDDDIAVIGSSNLDN